jgi:hypothetical protein
VDLTARLVGWGLARPRLLPVVAPGATRQRLALERLAREWGWPLVASPADADLLVGCGEVVGELAEAAALVWSQVPEPRARVELRDGAHAALALREGLAELLDRARQRGHQADPTPKVDRDDGRSDGQREEASSDRLAGAHHQHQSHEGHDEGHHSHQEQHPGHQPHQSQEGQMHMQGHEGHHMDHDMGMVAGLPLAGRAPDRDGLQLDRLSVPLGPILPDWPAGLRLRLVLQGDVVQEATAEVVGSSPAAVPPFWDEPWRRRRAGEPVTIAEASRRLAAARLDSLARLLAVAGLDGDAWRCRRLRDGLLTSIPPAAVIAEFARTARRLRRSRVLRAMTGGLGVVRPEAAGRHGLGEEVCGDVAARCLRWLDDVNEAVHRSSVPDADQPLDPADVGPGSRAEHGEPPSRRLLDLLAELVTGAELAAVRLVVASLDPDLDEVAAASPVGADGG